MKPNIPFLEHIAYNLRVSSVKQTAAAGSGHVTSALSAADIVAALFFYAMQYDPDNFTNLDNDRFILSKGHAAPVLYAVWKELGKLTQEDLLTYRQFDSVLEGHPTLRFPYSQAATGSLGIGLSIGLGMALNAKIDGRNYYTYVLMGDSETSEGSVWEAVEIAAYYKAHNLVGIVDMNRLGQSTETMYGYDAQAYAQRFAAFGWEVFVVDGHDMGALVEVFGKVRTVKEKPSMVIAKTRKGHGLDAMEDKEGYHGKPVKQENLTQALEVLQKNFPQAAAYCADYVWQPQVPSYTHADSACIAYKVNLPMPEYKKGQEIATRKAFGQALAQLGGVCDRVVSLDAEVKNSTFAELFEEQYPDRFIQCFIAEQNMVSMAVGLDRGGKIPFVSTFAAFLTRAHDQLRMAVIGQAKLRVVGSHAGVSIGQDGPSQMGLDDIAMMSGFLDAVVLYPSDAVSAYKLVECMVQNERGISYLRTTRAATPVIYHNSEPFAIGACKVLHKSDRDCALVIGAGITLHEALKAYAELQKEGISVAVIDLYCIKPLDVSTIVQVAKDSQRRVITVEDHYKQGGIGQMVSIALCNEDIDVTCLAVEKRPRSGTMEENLAFAGIDAQAIVQVVRLIQQVHG